MNLFLKKDCSYYDGVVVTTEPLGLDEENTERTMNQNNRYEVQVGQAAIFYLQEMIVPMEATENERNRKTL